jgi:hypothetical protein
MMTNHAARPLVDMSTIPGVQHRSAIIQALNELSLVLESSTVDEFHSRKSQLLATCTRARTEIGQAMMDAVVESRREPRLPILLKIITRYRTGTKYLYWRMHADLANACNTEEIVTKLPKLLQQRFEQLETKRQQIMFAMSSLRMIHDMLFQSLDIPKKEVKKHVHLVANS